MDGQQRRGRGRPKRRSRTAVLDQVMEHYWRDGIHTLSINEVCRRIGASKPSIYREFGSEDGLQEAVLGHYSNAILSPLRAFLALRRPFDETVEALIVGMTSPGDHPPGCLFTEMRLLRSGLGPASLGRLDAIEAERLAAFEQWYAGALERHEVISALLPGDAAAYMDAQLTLLLVEAGMRKPTEGVRARARLALSVLALER